MSYLSEFWGVLMTPSDNEGQPYVEATNQLSHVALGSIFSLAASVSWFVFFGEMPYRVYVWIAVVFGYVAIIEIWLQGWAGVDSLTDSYFVQCGATMTLWPVHEVGFNAQFVTLEFRPVLLGLLMLITAASLVLHLRPRIRKLFRNERMSNG